MGRHAARRRSRTSIWLVRLRAVLAGGLVLGIGTTATLAAWNDSEYATATVTASRFGIVGNTNGGAFSENPTTPRAIAFSPTVAAFSPNTVGFTQVGIQTTSGATGSTIGGTVVMSTQVAPPDATLANAYTYAVRVMPAGTTCTEPLFSNAAAPVVVANGTQLSTAVAASPANSQSVQAAGASTVSYCIRIAMIASPPSAVQGTSIPITWAWTGTSSS